MLQRHVVQVREDQHLELMPDNDGHLNMESVFGQQALHR